MEPKPLEELSDREVAQRLSGAERTLKELDAIPAAEVVQTGRSEVTLEAMSTSIAAITEAQTELSLRSEQKRRSEFREMLDALPRHRAMERGRRKPHPALGAPLSWLQGTTPPEVAGSNLDPSRLTHQEGEELAGIVKRFRELPEGTEKDPADVARYEELVGQWAGDLNLFQNYRRKKEVEARMAKIREEQRVDALPKRPIYAEQGSVTLPRFLFDWLQSPKDGSMTVADLGVLTAFLFMFENQVSLITGATFEEEDGETVLVVPGAIGGDVRFQRGANGDALDSSDSGHVRVRVALSACVRNKWFTAEQAGGQLRIKLGERARKVREGKEGAKAAA